MINLKRLKELRKEYHFTLSDMSFMLGISKSYYWQLENGDRKLYYDMAVKIARIFSLKPDDIFYKEEQFENTKK